MFFTLYFVQGPNTLEGGLKSLSEPQCENGNGFLLTAQKILIIVVYHSIPYVGKSTRDRTLSASSAKSTWKTTLLCRCMDLRRVHKFTTEVVEPS